MSLAPSRLEYWLQGPINGVPELLQPVAHALLQAKEEIQECLKEFNQAKLGLRPNGVASVRFHLQHIAGVLDRLFTYAKGEVLSEEQLNYLSREGKETEPEALSDLLFQLSAQVDKSIQYLKTIDVKTLADARAVGRKQLPSTVMGLLFHAAEHTMRHCGQLLVTARVIQDYN